MRIGALRYLVLLVICIMAARCTIDHLRTSIATMELSPMFQVKCEDGLKTVTRIRITGEPIQYQLPNGNILHKLPKTCKEL